MAVMAVGGEFSVIGRGFRVFFWRLLKQILAQAGLADDRIDGTRRNFPPIRGNDSDPSGWVPEFQVAPFL
jgi:hypothetical protein